MTQVRRLFATTMLVAGTLGVHSVAECAAPEGLPVKELGKEAYELVTDPAALPKGVQVAWALQLQQRYLNVAAAGATYNSTDAGGGTRHRLILAALSPKYAVVYFESGGIAVSRRVFVFSRAREPATFVWGGHPRETYDESKRFLAAIKNGKLWREEKRR